MPKWFVTDLDGTLLRSDASLSAYSAKMVTQALEQGLIVSYATARSWISSRRAVGTIPWKYPVVLYNGGLIFDPVSAEIVGGSFLPVERSNEIIAEGRSLGLIPLLFALDSKNREKVLHERLHRIGELHFHRSRPDDPRFQEVERLICPADYQSLLLTYIGLREELEPLAESIRHRLGDEVHMHFMKDNYIADHYFLEFSHPLANAHPELIRRADQVIERNDEDGVARFLEGVLRK